MMMRGVMTSLILILGIFCSAAWAQAHLDCSPGMVQCEGESPRRRCIATHWFCDGYDQCGNNWDEDPAVCATLECPQGSVPCEDGSPRLHCVLPRWFCDGWSQCENYWDEDPAVCARVPCEAGYYRCPDAPRRICLHDIWLCDGKNDCPDNSDEDLSVCRANGFAAARLCMNAIGQQCLLPTGFFGTTGFGMREQLELHQKLINTDLQELCGPVLVAQECATGVLASEVCQMPDADHPRVIQLQQTITVVNITVNHVCRDNVEVFDEHKECLLHLGRRRLAIVDSLDEQCPPEGAQPPCLPPELLDCAEGVVSQQCGQEIAGQLRTLGTKVMTGLGCDTQKRFEMNKKEKQMHRVFAAKKLMKKKTYSPLELVQKAFPTLF